MVGLWLFIQQGTAVSISSAYSSRAEYWTDGVIHITGVTAVMVASFGLLLATIAQPTAILSLPILAYCFGLIATFVFSAAYNMTIKPAPRAILRKFDRAAIFVMIAGTYSPMGILGIGGQWGTYMVATSWTIALAGVIGTLFFYERIKRLSLFLYLGQSWLIIIAIKPMYDALSLFAFSMIVVGGLTYTLGVIFYRRDDWKFNRAIWHVFVLGAATSHYLAILDIAKIA